MAAKTVDPAEKLIQNAVRQRESRRSGKSRTVAILLLLATALFGLLMIFAVYPGNPDDTSAPSCNGSTMSQDSICDEYVNGTLSNSYSYQDMLAQQQASSPFALGLGIVALVVVAVAFVPAMRNLDPSKPWGTARPEICPRCNQTNLREKQVTHVQTRGRVRTTWKGIVTLCSPECGLSAIRST